MTKPTEKKITTVRTHPRKVRVSPKNPDGVTIVDRHPRRVHGPALAADEIRKIAASRSRKGIVYPTADNLKFPDGNKYDELIAVWVDYFNEVFGITHPNAPLDPDLIKALIASESGFKTAPRNQKAIGITQITRGTLKALLDPEGEAKGFIFKNIRQKDLRDPEIAIPMGIRWIFRKKRLAAGKLGRPPTADEVVLEYKGLLKSRSKYQEKALKNFRENYARLKKK